MLPALLSSLSACMGAWHMVHCTLNTTYRADLYNVLITVQYSTVQCTGYSAVQYNLLNTVEYSTVQCTEYSRVQCTLYHTALYTVIHTNWVI